MARQERTPQERETLVFNNPEQAQEFSERVEKQQSPIAGVRQSEEVIAKELAAEFERHGEGVSGLHQPWEHSTAEHTEAQQLVDEAFQKDLLSAIRKAQDSKYYPRNLDLLHDVLTGKLYSLLVEQGLNRQKIPKWPLVILAVGLLVIVGLFIWLII